MTAGCEFCQHPSCWEYDVNQTRQGATSTSLPKQIKNQSKNVNSNKPKDTGMFLSSFLSILDGGL